MLPSSFFLPMCSKLLEGLFFPTLLLSKPLRKVTVIASFLLFPDFNFAAKGFFLFLFPASLYDRALSSSLFQSLHTRGGKEGRKPYLRVRYRRSEEEARFPFPIAAEEEDPFPLLSLPFVAALTAHTSAVLLSLPSRADGDSFQRRKGSL